MFGDTDLLAQLFTNLIENAITHTPAGTRITSRLRLVEGQATAEIFDTGPGIPMDEREKVFRRFYRRDASRGTEGAGLGLAPVAAVAALYQARCWIPGCPVGLCVRLVFPPLRADQAALDGRQTLSHSAFSMAVLRYIVFCQPSFCR